jgi:hypothetical protein
MSHPPNSDSKFGILAEFLGFLKNWKKWWLEPIVFIMLLMSMLIILTEGSSVTPFIYALF